jgi:hypothetical protein
MKPMSSQKDAFDLHQLYAAAYNILRSGFDVKAGRQEMKYGAGRLVWAPTWANRIRSFDSVVLRYRHEGLYGDALYGYDVKYNDNNFNRMQHYERLMGVYAGYQKDKASMLIEGYLLRQNINSSGKLRRYTAGARAQGRMPGDILCDIEFPYQFGKTNAGKIIRAYALHIDASRAFASVLWQPTVMLEYNEATGDKEPNDRQSNTFIPLYQSTHEPYGLMDFFRWENMREAALNVSLSPAKKLKFTPQTNFFWLMSTNDSWYDSTGTAFRTKTTGRRSHYVGQEISLRAAYDFNKNIKLEVGAAHFFTGRYVQQSGPNNDADWIYSQIYFKF